MKYIKHIVFMVFVLVLDFVGVSIISGTSRCAVAESDAMQSIAAR